MSILVRRLAIVALVAFLPLAACNTIQGVGKDITAVGKGVENATK